MKSKQVRDILLKEIHSVCKSIDQFCVSPGKDFVRSRKIPIEKLILAIIGMGNRSITNELLEFYDVSPNTPTASAFVQQRDKLKPEALETIFKSFSSKLLADVEGKMPILAVDGSDVQIATNPTDTESYFQGMNGQHPYNLLHLNALYDLNQNIYLDSIIQKKRIYNEHLALVSMVDRSTIPNLRSREIIPEPWYDFAGAQVLMSFGRTLNPLLTDSLCTPRFSLHSYLQYLRIIASAPEMSIAVLILEICMPLKYHKRTFSSTLRNLIRSYLVGSLSAYVCDLGILLPLLFLHLSSYIMY